MRPCLLCGGSLRTLLARIILPFRTGTIFRPSSIISVCLSPRIKQIRKARAIVLIGGEPEEEQTFTAKQIRQAVRNDGAKLIVVNDTPIRLIGQASQFIHINRDSYDAFALAFAGSSDEMLAAKMGVELSEFDRLAKTLGEADGDLIVIVGGNLSTEAQCLLANSAANFASDARRVFIQPLVPYSNSVGSNDMAPGKMTIDGVLKNAKALLIGGSLSGIRRF